MLLPCLCGPEPGFRFKSKPNTQTKQGGKNGTPGAAEKNDSRGPGKTRHRRQVHCHGPCMRRTASLSPRGPLGGTQGPLGPPGTPPEPLRRPGWPARWDLGLWELVVPIQGRQGRRRPGGHGQCKCKARRQAGTASAKTKQAGATARWPAGGEPNAGVGQTQGRGWSNPRMVSVRPKRGVGQTQAECWSDPIRNQS